MHEADAEANLREYLYGGPLGSGRLPEERYSSFDYCFNHFQAFREARALRDLASPDNLQVSCLQLGFYLASWGMLRGSALLLNRSVRFYEPVIRSIASADDRLWQIDADRYTPENIWTLLQFRKTLAEVWGTGNAPSEILATKIMLGVFGNVPAFDSLFKRGLGVATFGHKALQKIGAFYNANSDLIERYRVPTLDFVTGLPTQRRYTRAKVIDMVFFIEGTRRA